jgi:serine/threonine protein kinase
MLLISKEGIPPLKEPEYYSWELQSFIELCLATDPDQRMTADELLEHEFPAKTGTDNDMVDLIEQYREAKVMFDEEMAQFGDLAAEIAALDAFDF